MERVYEVGGVPGAIAAKGIGRAVNRVRAGLDADVDDGAGPAAEFGRGIGLDVEFLDRIDGKDGGGIAEGQRGVGNALPRERLVAIESFDVVVVL